MTPVNPFILKNKEKMITFLDELSVSRRVKCGSFVSEIQGQSVITKSLGVYNSRSLLTPTLVGLYNNWSLTVESNNRWFLVTYFIFNGALFTDTSSLSSGIHTIFSP